MMDEDFASRDQLLISLLLRIASLENLLLNKNVITTEELSNSTEGYSKELFEIFRQYVSKTSDS
jgi:hypothetical protein